MKQFEEYLDEQIKQLDFGDKNAENLTPFGQAELSLAKSLKEYLRYISTNRMAEAAYESYLDGEIKTLEELKRDGKNWNETDEHALAVYESCLDFFLKMFRRAER